MISLMVDNNLTPKITLISRKPSDSRLEYLRKALWVGNKIMAEIRGQHTNRWEVLEVHREQRGGGWLECRVLTVFIRQGIRVLCRGGRATRGKVCLWCRESTQASSRTSPDHDRIFNWDKASERAQITMGRGRRDRMLGVGSSTTPRDQ